MLENLQEQLEPLLREFQIDNWGNVEKAYKVDNSVGIKLFKNLLLLTHPHAQDDLELPQEVISLHPADGVTYLNDTIVITYNSPLTETIRTKYKIPDWYITAGKSFVPDPTSARGPSFTIKYDMVTGHAFPKIYDKDFTKYPIPDFPEGSMWAKNEGVGIHLTGDSREDIADFYFGHQDRDVVRKWAGDLYPEFHEDFDVLWRGYCLSINSKTGERIKMKRYIYMRDKGLFNPYAE